MVLNVVVALCYLLGSSVIRASSLYHTAGDVLHFYSHAAKLHPGLLRFEDVKLTPRVSLPIATISNFTQVPAKEKPVALLIFGEHAREVITTEVAIWMTKVLVGDFEELLVWPEMAPALRDAGLGQAAAADTLHALRLSVLDRLTLKVLPIENMDGRTAWEAGDLCRRKTTTDVDLNRNWDFAWSIQNRESDMYGGEAPFSEPQSKYLRDQAHRWRPLAFMNVHSGEWAVYTPWDSRATMGAGLPKDLETLVGRLGAICDCMAGPAGAVSNYLAFGTSMDYMYVRAGVLYPFTLEVYGGGGEGKLRGRGNPPLSSFPVTTADSAPVRHSRRLLQHPAPEDQILKLVHGSPESKQMCFKMYNPEETSEYREVISRWVVMLLVMLDHVAKSEAATAAHAGH